MLKSPFASSVIFVSYWFVNPLGAMVVTFTVPCAYVAPHEPERVLLPSLFGPFVVAFASGCG